MSGNNFEFSIEELGIGRFVDYETIAYKVDSVVDDSIGTEYWFDRKDLNFDTKNFHIGYKYRNEVFKSRCLRRIRKLKR